MKTRISRRAFVGGALTLSTAVLLTPRRGAFAAGLDKLGVDYAYYNPPSLILKKYGWLEEALAPPGTKVECAPSLGPNKANAFLAANAIQLGSTAGSAALLAPANGSPIRTVYLYSQPEWTATVIGKDSPLRNVKEITRKKNGAAKG